MSSRIRLEQDRKLVLVTRYIFSDYANEAKNSIRMCEFYGVEINGGEYSNDSCSYQPELDIPVTT